MTNATSLRDELILSHMPQVELLARRLHRRCPQAELDDLISAGAVGLIAATGRYDESKGCLLRTLAEHRIRGAMLDYLRQIDPLPRSVRRFQKRRDTLAAEMAAAGGPLNHARLALTLGVSPGKYAALSRMIVAAEPLSIHEPSIARKLTG